MSEILMQLSPIEGLNAGLCFFSVFILLVVGVSMVALIRMEHKKEDVFIFGVSMSHLFACLFEAGSWFYQPVSENSLLYRVCLIGSYAMAQCTILFLHIYIVYHVKKTRSFSMGLIGCAVVFFILSLGDWIASMWTGWLYNYSNNGFAEGPYWIISQIVSMALITIDVFYLFIQKKHVRKNELITSVVLLVLGLFGFFMERLTGIAFLYTVITIAILLLYIQWNLQKSLLLYRQESALASERTKVVYSQIKPHFLYNALSAIMGIEGNPPETRKALGDFGKYLRGNLDTMANDHPISIENEMKHVKLYTNLELLRFEDIHVEYDLKSSGFLVPPLAVQMLVENAILHGVSFKENGGSVRIRTYEDSDYYYVSVSDDGVGYEENRKDETRSHVGIDNCRTRLELMVDGTLSIAKREEGGTIAIITIPKEGDVKHK